MKDVSGDLRRFRGRGLASRVRRGNQERLSEVSGEAGRDVRGRAPSRAATPKAARQPDGCTNWRVVRYRGGDIVAIEPNREFEHTFEGGVDPFQEALEYAAKQLRGEA